MMWIKRGDILFNADEFSVIVADREDYRIKADTKDGKIITLYKARSEESLMRVYDHIVLMMAQDDMTIIRLPAED